MQKKLPEDSVFKKKGFFVALYACVGTVLVLAAVVSYHNFNSLDTSPQQNTNPLTNEVNAQGEKPNSQIVLTPADQEAIDKAAADQKASANRIIAESQSNSQEIAKKVTPAATISITPGVTGTIGATSVTGAPNPTTAPDKAVTTAENPTSAEKPTTKEFEQFAEGEKMIWPVTGEGLEIIMDYSMDRLIYDKTLDQYRTNDNICIAANPGSPIKAATAGVVVKVEKTHKDGNTITIDNGNGWTTTYGQLMDRMMVKEGDVVKKEQIIGGVASPSIYSVRLGSHVSFKVQKDDTPVDHKNVLVLDEVETKAEIISPDDIIQEDTAENTTIDKADDSANNTAPLN